jgi:hypothetical protein
VGGGVAFGQRALGSFSFRRGEGPTPNEVGWPTELTDDETSEEVERSVPAARPSAPEPRMNLAEPRLTLAFGSAPVTLPSAEPALPEQEPVERTEYAVRELVEVEVTATVAPPSRPSRAAPLEDGWGAMRWPDGEPTPKKPGKAAPVVAPIVAPAGRRRAGRGDAARPARRRRARDHHPGRRRRARDHHAGRRRRAGRRRSRARDARGRGAGDRRRCPPSPPRPPPPPRPKAR